MPPSPYPCTVTDCARLRHSHAPHCLMHGQGLIRQGNTQGTRLTGIQRQSYVSAVLSMLRVRLRARKKRAGKRGHPARHKDAALVQLLYDLTALFKFRIERPSLHDWKSYKPRKKAHAVLWSVYQRWPHEQDAALFIVATCIGTLLALKLEPQGLEHTNRYRTTQLLRAVSSLMRTEETTVTTERNGKVSTLLLKRSRPKPTGRYITGHLLTLIVSPVQFYLTEAGREFEASVLRHMIKYPKVKQRAILLTRQQRARNQTK